jgi:hypothetical protein
MEDKDVGATSGGTSRYLTCRAMTRALTALGVSVTMALLALGFPAHTQADTTIAQVLRPTPISAVARTQLWSSYDAGSGTYELTTRTHDKGIAFVPVAPRGVPFDADLWVSEGELGAVYSRCRREPALNILALPRWATGRGCDLYTFDFNTGKERKLGPPNTKSASEFLPAVWPGALAFFRVYERRRGIRGRRPHLYVIPNVGLFGPPPGEGRKLRLTRFPVGTTKLCGRVGRPKRRVCRRVEATPQSLDFRGGVAFVWEHSGRGEGPTYEVVLHTFNFQTRKGRRAVLGRGTTGLSANIFLSPTFSRDGWLYYAQTCGGEPSPCGRRQRYHRYNLASGRRQQARAPASMLWFTHDQWTGSSGDSFYLRAPGGLFDSPGNPCGDVPPPGQACTIVLASPIRFR